jgi:hypothetical protein
MWLKKGNKVDLENMAKLKVRPRRAQEEKNDDTTARVKAVLAQLNGKDYVVLASYAASKGPDHEVRMSTKNHAVFCSGKCWQYSKTGSCKHLEHFKANIKPVKFGRIEKQ